MPSITFEFGIYFNYAYIYPIIYILYIILYQNSSDILRKNWHTLFTKYYCAGSTQRITGWHKLNTQNTVIHILNALVIMEYTNC
jgi:hypothetical protein